jgi:hypothetical protein
MIDNDTSQENKLRRVAEHPAPGKCLLLCQLNPTEINKWMVKILGAYIEILSAAAH